MNEEIKPREEKKIPLVEMFGPTIEGEGSLAGMQTFFLRFGLCDYKCTRCDSMHAVDPRLVKAGATYMTQIEIAQKLVEYAQSVNASHIKNVTFSGGNPAIHDLMELVTVLKESGWKIYVETQGTKHPEWLKRVDHIVVSPKSPGMGEKFNPKVFSEFMISVHDGHYYRPPVTIKIVVFSAQDLEFAVGVAQLIDSIFPMRHILVNNFYLSLGNDQPPVFHLAQDTYDGKASVGSENIDKKALVDHLLSLYNQLSNEIMKDHRLSFAKFLPQLHVLGGLE